MADGGEMPEAISLVATEAGCSLQYGGVDRTVAACTI